MTHFVEMSTYDIYCYMINVLHQCVFISCKQTGWLELRRQHGLSSKQKVRGSNPWVSGQLAKLSLCKIMNRSVSDSEECRSIFLLSRLFKAVISSVGRAGVSCSSLGSRPSLGPPLLNPVSCHLKASKFSHTKAKKVTIKYTAVHNLQLKGKLTQCWWEIRLVVQ